MVKMVEILSYKLQNTTMNTHVLNTLPNNFISKPIVKSILWSTNIELPNEKIVQLSQIYILFYFCQIKHDIKTLGLIDIDGININKSTWINEWCVFKFYTIINIYPITITP
jgi:hypothetical protein